MPLETATYVSQLVDANPADTDSEGQGGAHLRLIKATLLATFPNLTAAAVNATTAQLNALASATTALLGSLATGIFAFAAGTAGAPSVTFGSDATTGLYGSAAGKLDMSISGTDTVEVTSAGLNVLQGGLLVAGTPVAINQFSTGDAKFTFKTTADTGWIMAADQTIGPAASAATYANNNCQALYELIWNVTNAAPSNAPVTGGRGANAAADWTAAKPMQLCKTLGRALGVAGAGSGLTARNVGDAVGEETHTLAGNEIPAHTHPITDNGHDHPIYVNSPGNLSVDQGIAVGTTSTNKLLSGGGNTDTLATTGITVDANTGGGGAHNNMQPTGFMNLMICL